MAQFLRIVNIGGKQFEFCILEEYEIKDFFHQETEKHVYGRTQEGNSMYLQFNNDDVVLSDVYALLDNGNVASFCIRPKYKRSVISRIYTSPKIS